MGKVWLEVFLSSTLAKSGSSTGWSTYVQNHISLRDPVARHGYARCCFPSKIWAWTTKSCWFLWEGCSGIPRNSKATGALAANTLKSMFRKGFVSTWESEPPKSEASRWLRPQPQKAYPSPRKHTAPCLRKPSIFPRGSEWSLVSLVPLLLLICFISDWWATDWIPQ